MLKKIFGKSGQDENIPLHHLTSVTQLDEVDQISRKRPVVLFKHSTSCMISAMAKDRLMRRWNISEEQAVLYYLDLLQYRQISNEIAERYRVPHESPQVIVVRNGQAVFDTSHGNISVEGIRSLL